MGSIARIEIPQEILESAGLIPEEARVELAVALYASHRLGVGKARELAGDVALAVPPTAFLARRHRALRRDRS